MYGSRENGGGGGRRGGGEFQRIGGEEGRKEGRKGLCVHRGSRLLFPAELREGGLINIQCQIQIQILTIRSYDRG